MEMLQSGWHWRSKSGPTTKYNGEVKIDASDKGVTLSFGPIRNGDGRYRVQIRLSGTELGAAFDSMSKRINGK